MSTSDRRTFLTIALLQAAVGVGGIAIGACDLATSRRGDVICAVMGGASLVAAGFFLGLAVPWRIDLR